MSQPRLGKIILTTVILGSLFCARLAGAGTFSVVFQDVTLATGGGFDDPTPVSHPNAATLGELRRWTALHAFQDLGGLITFHASANPDIVFLPSALSGPDPVGAASAFYNVSLGSSQRGYLYQHITTGVDPSPGAPDANIKMNFGIAVLNGQATTINSDYLVVDETMVDLYTVVLHEAMHALGIASLIDANGKSQLGGSLNGPFARFDDFLVDGSAPLISGGSFAVDPLRLTSNALQYRESGNAIARLPIHSGSPFQSGASLSHFDRVRATANDSNVPYAGLPFDYVMGSGRAVRSVSNPEKDVLCDLGYDLGALCSNRFPIGVNDVGPSTTPGLSVCFNVLANDIHGDPSPLSIDPGLGVVILNGNGPGASATYSAGTICFTSSPTFVGTAAIRYYPSDGARVGNATILTIAVTGTSCPGDRCNLICNGGLEGGVPAGSINQFNNSCPSMIDNWCGYGGTPDYFARNAGGASFRIPNNYLAAFGSCAGGVNTWDFPNAGNDRYAGFFCNPSCESMYAPLVTPLVPGATYRLTFHAAASTAKSVSMGFFSQIGGPIDFPLPNVPIAACDGSNNWTTVGPITFVAPASPTLNFFMVGGVSATNGAVFVDDFTLTMDGPPLALTQTVDNPAPHLGETATYSIQVCNTGLIDATSLVITDVLPDGLVATGGTFTYPAHTIPTLAAGSCVTLTVTARVTGSVSAGMPLASCAFVSSGGVSCIPPTGSRCADIVVPSSSLICGSVWHDLNMDGVRDPSEPTLGGRAVLLEGGPSQATVVGVTNGAGDYCFNGLSPGSYTLYDLPGGGWMRTYPMTERHTIELVAGAALVDVDFGEAVCAPEVIRIRTGQVAGVPGACGQEVDGFTMLVAPTCGTPLRPAAFTPADFLLAQDPPHARVVNPFFGQLGALACDPDARWISQFPLGGPNGNGCSNNFGGDPQSILYATEFFVTTAGDPTGTLNVCWATDDVLGDAPAEPNPAGVYLNGSPLAISGGGAGAETAASQTVQLNTGSNWIYFYQRDGGCGVSALILSATVSVPCGTVSVVEPVETANTNELWMSAEPNPFSTQTRIAFTIAKGGAATVGIFDASGRRLRQWNWTTLEAGPHSVVWNGRTDDGRVVAPGVLFYRLEVGGQVLKRKVVRTH